MARECDNGAPRSDGEARYFSSNLLNSFGAYSRVFLLFIIRGREFNISEFKRNLVVPGIITFFINIQQLSQYFFVEWKKALVQKEELEKEKIQQQYQSLKDQLNPHFLFNSLNTLSELVEEDKEKASKYISKMADVYRYLLDHNTKSTIDLSKELEFLDSYLHLSKMKFGQWLEVSMDIAKEHEDKNIFPLSLQLLVENVIKHNVIAQNKPIHIKIYTENNCVVVENNLRVKSEIVSSQTGLANIKHRYHLIGVEGFEVEKRETSFIVKLPLL